jgi:hypothetical protein
MRESINNHEKYEKTNKMGVTIAVLSVYKPEHCYEGQ